MTAVQPERTSFSRAARAMKGPIYSAVLLSTFAGLLGQTQPTGLTLSRSTIEAGQCYTLSAGNGANMTLDLRFNIDGGTTQYAYGWPTLDS